MYASRTDISPPNHQMSGTAKLCVKRKNATGPALNGWVNYAASRSHDFCLGFNVFRFSYAFFACISLFICTEEPRIYHVTQFELSSKLDEKHGQWNGKVAV